MIKISLEIIKKKEMPLLSRTRVVAVHSEKGPTVSRRQVRTQLAKQLKEDEEKVVIKHIYPQFGKKDSKIIANVYSKKEDMEKFENPSLVKKHAKEEAKEEGKEGAKEEGSAASPAE